MEPQAGFTAATLLSLSYWTPFFYVPFALPSASWWAGPVGREPHIAGHIFYPNLAVVNTFALLTAVAWWMSRGVHRGRQA